MIDLKCGNCLELLKQIPDNSIDLIVTSPPYNKGYWSSNRNINNYSFYKTKVRKITYGKFDDNLTPQEYEKQQREFLSECIRIIKPTGSIFYNHIDILCKHQTIHPKWVYDFPLKQVIIWNRKSTPKLDKSYFFPITEYIYWIQKNKTSRVKFDRNKAMFNKNIWDINPDRKNDFPAPFPIELALNCILATTEENALVLDPFMGSGTTGIACINSNRNFIGFELDEGIFEKTKRRIEEEQQKKDKQENTIFDYL
jgi:modification methylase